MINKKYILSLLAALTMLASCTEEDYMLYDTTQTDSVFFDYLNSKKETDSIISYNFGYDIAQTHEIRIPVTLMGVPKEHVRHIELRAVADSTDMVEGINYTIERNEIAAMATQDTVVIKLLRDKDDEIQTREKRLLLEIVASDDLNPTGQKTFTIKYSDIRPTDRPEWWYTYAGLPVYSFENAQLFFQYFYELMPKANKGVYDELISTYGDYFVDAVSLQGPFAMYDAVLYKYVCIPMYNDTKDTIEWQKEPTVN